MSQKPLDAGFEQLIKLYTISYTVQMPPYLWALGHTKIQQGSQKYFLEYFRVSVLKLPKIAL